MGILWYSEQTEINSLHSTGCYVFVIQTEPVSCAFRNESLHIVKLNHSLYTFFNVNYTSIVISFLTVRSSYIPRFNCKSQ
jgi:hypothetical protein